MANAIPASSAPKKEPKVAPKSPNVEYIGEGAEKVKFTVDPKAKRTRVYASGVVVTDY